MAGRAILRNTLLPPAQTRRWMNVVTHSTSSLTTSVGAPWEILRVTTSRGVVGEYSSLLVLVPDFDIGWAILSAADTLTTAAVGVEVFADLITEVLFPAIEAAAKDNTAVTFAGTYKATNGLNSSISILTDVLPGLNIQSWVSNGTNALEAYLAVSGLTNVNSTVRLYPTNLFQDSPKQQAFRVADVLPRNSTGGVFSSGCGTWVGVDVPTYGNVGVDEFVFHFDEYGRGVSVEPRAFRITLKKGLKV